MRLSRVGWPRRDGLTSHNRLSPRRIGVLHGSSTLLLLLASVFFSLSLFVTHARRDYASRRLEFDRVSHAWRGCARALCTLFPWRGVGHPLRKRSFVARRTRFIGSTNVVDARAPLYRWRELFRWRFNRMFNKG